MYTQVNSRKTFYSNGNGKIIKGQPNVVFIHGAGHDHSVWVMPSRYFARHHYNVFALDLPAHGRSAGTPLKSIDAMADWICAALDVLDVDAAAIVGHSMGSLVALNFSARYANRTRVLALLGTSTPMPVTDVLLNAARDNEHDAFDMANTWSHSPFGEMGGNENPGISMMMSGQRLLERTPEDVYFADLNACNAFADGDRLATQITSESLMFVAAQDKMTAPASALKVAQLIPQCRVIHLNPCGHAMLSEQPNAVLDGLASIV